jgi:hypothetical protein
MIAAYASEGTKMRGALSNHPRGKVLRALSE